mgnify:CR=1 FL=1
MIGLVGIAGYYIFQRFHLNNASVSTNAAEKQSVESLSMARKSSQQAITETTNVELPRHVSSNEEKPTMELKSSVKKQRHGAATSLMFNEDI